jgi:hypothetical protein
MRARHAAARVFLAQPLLAVLLQLTLWRPLAPANVILSGCDFFVFPQKAMLQTMSFNMKKSPFANGARSSGRSEGFLFCMAFGFLCVLCGEPRH